MITTLQPQVQIIRWEFWVGETKHEGSYEWMLAEDVHLYVSCNLERIIGNKFSRCLVDVLDREIELNERGYYSQ